MLEKLKNIVLSYGISLFGVAELTEDLKKDFLLEQSPFLEGIDKAICLGYHLSDKIIDDIVDSPTLLYAFHYKRVNILLDNTALLVTTFLQDLDYAAIPIPASQMVDWDNPRGHLSHRLIAYYAGLGWIGRSRLLVNPKFGARVRLVSILTNAPLPANKPLEYNCGECFKCVEMCPASAIASNSENFDITKCDTKLREFSKMQGIGVRICGICVRVCKPKL